MSSVGFSFCPTESPEAKACFNYFDNGEKEPRILLFRKEQIVLKNGLKLIISYIIPLTTAAAGDGLLQLDRTPNPKFFSFPAKQETDWNISYLPHSLIDRCFVCVCVCLSVYWPNKFGFSATLPGALVAGATRRSPASSASSLDVKAVQFCGIVRRTSRHV